MGRHSPQSSLESRVTQSATDGFTREVSMLWGSCQIGDRNYFAELPHRLSAAQCRQRAEISTASPARFVKIAIILPVSNPTLTVEAHTPVLTTECFLEQGTSCSIGNIASKQCRG